MNTGKSGNTVRTSTGKTEENPEKKKPAGPAPVESTKKFEELLKDGKKKGEDSGIEGKKEAGVFDSHHQRVIPTAAKQQAPLDTLKGQTKSGGEMKITKEGKSGPKEELGDGVLKAQIFSTSGGETKITKEGKEGKEGKSGSKEEMEEGVLKSQIFGKTDKTQVVQGKSEGGEKGQGGDRGAEEKGKIKVELTSEKEGEFKMKVNEGPAIPSAFLEAQQPAVKGPLGQNLAPVTATQQTGTSARVEELTKLATTMLSTMRVPDAASTAGNEKTVTMRFGDANPNLKNVEVSITRNGGDLRVEFITSKNVDAGNYLNQNKEGLTSALRNGLSDIKEIRIDIAQTRSDTQKDDSQGQSRGQYVPEKTDEQKEEQS